MINGLCAASLLLNSMLTSRAADQGGAVFLFCIRCHVPSRSPAQIFRLSLHASHNSQRWMSRLGQRRRAQRSVVTTVNCRIPRTNRNLNAVCAFGTCLKVCLFQCLSNLLPAPSSPACSRVPRRWGLPQPLVLWRLGAPPLQSNWRIGSAWPRRARPVALRAWEGSAHRRPRRGSPQGHEVRSANPPNLSI